MNETAADLFFLVAVAAVLLGAYVAFCFVVSAAARGKGRSPVAFFWMALLGSPILAGIVLGLMGNASGAPLPAARVRTYTAADFNRAR